MTESHGMSEYATALSILNENMVAMREDIRAMRTASDLFHDKTLTFMAESEERRKSHHLRLGNLEQVHKDNKVIRTQVFIVGLSALLLFFGDVIVHYLPHH